MRTQTAILESPVRLLTESPLRVLQGNQDLLPTTARHSRGHRFIKQCASFWRWTYPYGFDESGYPFYPQNEPNAFFFREGWGGFVRSDDAWAGSGNSYQGISSIVGPGQTPVVSGYPASISSGMVPTGTGGINTFDNPPVFFQQFMFDRSHPDSRTHWLMDSGGGETCDRTKSGLVDNAGYFNTLKNDTLAVEFSEDWSINPFLLFYDDAPFQDNLNPADFTGLPSHSNNNIDYPPTIGPVADFPYNALAFASSGWNIGSAGNITMWRGQLRFNEIVSAQFPLYFWVARFQVVGARNSAFDFHYRLGFVQDGFITEAGPLGYTVMECPFPSSVAFPIENLNNFPIVQELNFLFFQGSPFGFGDYDGV